MRTTAIALIVIVFALPAVADTTITYQGQLQDSNQPYNGQVELTFELFDDSDPAVGNSVAGPLTINDVPVTDGLFQVELDFGATYDQPVWLEVTIGADTLQPRQQITATPFATHALNVADGVSGVWTKDGDNTHFSIGNVGIRTTTTDVPLRVNGHLITGNSSNTITDSFNSAIIGGSSNSTSNVSQNSVIAGGGGNTMTGTDSIIAAGLANEVSSWRSFAGGYRAKAIHDSTFVWADSVDEDFTSTGTDQFLIRSTGGSRFETGSQGMKVLSESSSVAGAAVQAESTHSSGIALVGRNESDDATLVLNNRGTGPIFRAFNVGSERFRIHNNGNLFVDGRAGIGTLNPQASMHVQGDFRLSFNDFRISFNPGLSDGTGQNILMGHITNTIDGHGNTISGGGSSMFSNNIDNASSGTIGGGEGNFIDGPTNTTTRGTTISGGLKNTASNWGATVIGGESNTASGWVSTVAGGFSNEATGTFSFSAGVNAHNTHNGTFLWADNTGGIPVFSSESDNEFAARSTGGVRFVTGLDTNEDPNAGVKLDAGGNSWQSISDRHSKNEVTVVDPSEVLGRVVQMPISEYSYKSQDSSIRHMGPMAQDFHPLFGLGEDKLRISAMNLAGVSLAAIQGLHEHHQAMQARIERLEDENAELRELAERNSELEDRLAALESVLLSHQNVTITDQ